MSKKTTLYRHRAVLLSAVFAVLLASRQASAADAAPVHRAPTGFIADWLICGPFPNPLPPGATRNSHQGRCEGFETDYLKEHGGEAAIEPIKGMAHKMPDGRTVAWHAVATPGTLVNFDAEFSPNENVVAYAFCRLESDVDQDVILSVGSDDGIKIWIDDRLVHENHVSRGVVADQDTVVVRLTRGVHRCLVKVDEGSGGWGFSLRVQSLAGAASVARLQFDQMAALSTSPTLGQPGDIVAISVFDPERARQFDIAYPVKYAVANLAGDRIAALSSRTNTAATFYTRTWRPGGYRVTAEIDPPGSGTVQLSRFIYLGDFERAADKFVREALVGRNARSHPAMTLAYCVERLQGLRDSGAGALRRSAAECIEYLGWLEEFQRRNWSDDVFRDRRGSHVRGYWSDVDETAQFYSLYVPSRYDRGEPMPLVVVLHGYDPSWRPYAARNRLINAKMRRLAEQFGYVVLEPFGRGNAFYRGIGRADVLRTIDEVCRDYDVDRDRVYLMGYSMGGMGTWYIGTFFADQFAAIAPIFGGWKTALSKDPPADLTSHEKFLIERARPYDSPENLLHTPVFINHGDRDELVYVESSRIMAQRLQRLGYDVRYWEHPDKGHGGLPIEETLFEWFGRYERPRAPSRIRLKVSWLRHAKTHWLAVERFEQLFAFATIDARIAPDNLVTIESRNASILTLSPPKELVDAGRRLDVVWNGREADVERIGDRQWRIMSPETPQRVLTAPLRKTAAREGPMEDVWSGPFLVVQGTQAPSPIMRAVVEAEARNVAESWRERHHATPRVKHDADVTSGDMKAYNLIIVGGPDENFIARHLLPELPVRIGADSIDFFGEKFGGADLGLAFIYPNPLYPNRYIMFLLGTSPAGLFGLDARCDKQFDFFVVDGKTMIEQPVRRTMVAGGYFDQEWQYRPQYALARGDDGRAVRTPHRAPVHAGVADAPDTLYLSDLAPARQSGAFRNVALDRAAFGDSLRLGQRRRFRDNVYRKGIATAVPHLRNGIEYALAGQYEKFRAVVGLQCPAGTSFSPTERTNTRVIFTVMGDGKILWTSPVTWDSQPVDVDVGVEGVQTLSLSVRNATTWHYRADSANWCNARVER